MAIIDTRRNRRPRRADTIRRDTRDERVRDGDRRIGERFRRLRNGSGLTQDAVAAAMRQRGHTWHKATISSIEAGERPLKLTEATDVSAILGITAANGIMDLLGIGPDPSWNEECAIQAAREVAARRRSLERARRVLAQAERDLAHALDTIDPDERERVRARTIEILADTTPDDTGAAAA
ncbi:hypothetical protein COO72_12360 [Bifidobacterium callitrichos]|nr:hypothetical protein COO72_12360 [Bifidobacterium callitrichos]